MCTDLLFDDSNLLPPVVAECTLTYFLTRAIFSPQLLKEPVMRTLSPPSSHLNSVFFTLFPGPCSWNHSTRHCDVVFLHLGSSFHLAARTENLDYPVHFACYLKCYQQITPARVFFFFLLKNTLIQSLTKQGSNLSPNRQFYCTLEVCRGA